MRVKDTACCENRMRLSPLLVVGDLINIGTLYERPRRVPEQDERRRNGPPKHKIKVCCKISPTTRVLPVTPRDTEGASESSYMRCASVECLFSRQITVVHNSRVIIDYKSVIVEGGYRE